VAAASRKIDAPGASDTRAFGINDTGQSWGSCVTARATHGFLDTAGTFTQIDFPGATSTNVTGINDSGEIVGLVGPFSDVVGNHGFIATLISEVPEPSSVALLGVGVIGVGILRRQRRT
jgi:uncharacterized membrane protein